MARPRPTAILVIAVLHFVFGGLGLLCDLCTGVQLAGGQAFTPGGTEGAQQQKFTKDFEAYVAEKVPYNQAVTITTLGFDVMLGILMIAAGVGLLQMQPWGRQLSIIYAVLSILVKVANIVYLWLVSIPVIVEFTKPLVNKGKEEAVIAQIIQTTAYVSGILPVIFMIYPLIVLIVMLRSSVAAAFRGEGVVEPPDVGFGQPEGDRW
jgi:hypothetical protein